MRVKFTDRFEFADRLKPTQDGYLAADARIARTGVQVYRGHEVGRPDMDRVRVYRPASEVFKRDAMKSFAHRPVTYLHPPENVRSKNWRQYAVGHTGSDVVRDGDFIRVPMMLMDAAAIDIVKNDGVRELSAGYSTEIDWTPGKTQDGEAYDAVQRDIRGNHLAVVPVARGGEMLRLGDWKPRRGVSGGDDDDDEPDRDDEDYYDAKPFFYDREFSTERRDKLAKTGAAMKGGGYPIQNEGDLRNAIQAIGRAKNRSATIAHIKTRARALGLTKLIPENWDAYTITNIGDRKMRTLTINDSGQAVTIDLEDGHAAFLQAHLARLNQTILDQKKQMEEKAAEEEEDEEEETRAQDSIRTALDAQAGEITMLRKQLKDQQWDAKRINKAVTDRMTVIAGARTLVGDKVRLDDERSDSEIRRFALSSMFANDELTEMSDAAVIGAFNAAIRMRGSGKNTGAVVQQQRTQDERPLPFAFNNQPSSFSFGRMQQTDSNAALRDAIAESNRRRGLADAGTSLEQAEALRDQAFAELEKRSQEAWKTKAGQGVR